MDHEEVRPIRPIAPYIGGKRGLAKALVGVVEKIPHETYAEPFVGMGGVFFRRCRRPKAEVINDINRDIATLFRILQRHYPQFLDTIRFQITSRAEFERLVKTDPDTLTDTTTYTISKSASKRAAELIISSPEPH